MSPADVKELGLNAGFVPDIGHTVRLIPAFSRVKWRKQREVATKPNYVP